MSDQAAQGRRVRFEELIASANLPLTALTPADGLSLVTRFFCDEFPVSSRALLYAGWDKAEDSGRGAYLFLIAIYWTDESPVDDLTLVFQSGSADLRRGENHWCMTPEEVWEFRSRIENSADFRVWGNAPASDVSLTWGAMRIVPPEPPVQPGDRMTAEQWGRSEDPIAMLKALWAGWVGEEADLVRVIHRYLLACGRTIWRLLPMEESRRGIEVAERYHEGRATREEFFRAEWEAEGVAFFLEPHEHEPENEGPEEREWRQHYEADRSARIAALIAKVEAEAPEELCRLAGSGPDAPPLATRELLTDAAYFADLAMVYPGIHPRLDAIERYRRFLSVTLLREMAGDVFSPLAHG